MSDAIACASEAHSISVRLDGQAVNSNFTERSERDRRPGIVRFVRTIPIASPLQQIFSTMPIAFGC